MKKTCVLTTEDDLLVDLKLNIDSASLLTEFAKKIVRPYFSGNINKELKALIQNAIRDEDFVINHLKIVECEDNG